MKKIIYMLLGSLMILGCNNGKHYHDGKYETQLMFMKINYNIDGDYITIDNSLTGISKLKCQQYPDRIEYTEDNGTRRIITALENGDLKFSEVVILRKIEQPTNSVTNSSDNTSENSKSELSSHQNLSNTTSTDKSNSMLSLKTESEKQYQKHRGKLLNEGVAIDDEQTFNADLNNDKQDEIVKYYTLAPKEGGCMYVGRGIIVYENTKVGIVETRYEPDYAFEFTGIENGKITVSKLDFSENDMCYPTIPTKGYLDFKNHKLHFIKS
ncbi:hypothetical protein [Elizabethkingia anophelis]|uniref:hypothetical protein n=1 Tax=Elizabethkingia anophelis TaxID=1117645 RepID=UPI00136A137F|nr:hypothetical protein [Elizabethkingia anophelis]MYY28996.1 hypothetical protein [Elizabethkingia anophelis]